MATALAPTDRPESPDVLPSPLSGGVPAIKAAINELTAIRTFVKAEMKENVDFGVIPGTNNKNVLLLPGAQKTAMYFNCFARYGMERTELGHGHLEVVTTVRLISRTSHRIVGEGIGSCSTMETKYRYRKAARQCPKCRSEAIIKGKEEYGGGWVCYKAKGGCGAKFADGDTEIEDQETGQVQNANIHDARNTVLKMSKKRALVDAALSLGCMAELFTQDLDETFDLTAPQEPPAERPAKSTPEAKQPRRDRQAAKPEPSKKAAAPKQEAPRAETWASWIVRELQTRNDEFANEQMMANVPKDQHVNEVMNQFEAANLVVSTCIHQGMFKMDRVAQSDNPNKRDRTKVLQAVTSYFNEYPDWVKETVIERYLEKQDELARKLGVYNPDADPVDEDEEALVNAPF